MPGRTITARVCNDHKNPPAANRPEMPLPELADLQDIDLQNTSSDILSEAREDVIFCAGLYNLEQRPALQSFGERAFCRDSLRDLRIELEDGGLADEYPGVIASPMSDANIVSVMTLIRFKYHKY